MQLLKHVFLIFHSINYASMAIGLCDVFVSGTFNSRRGCVLALSRHLEEAAMLRKHRSSTATLYIKLRLPISERSKCRTFTASFPFLNLSRL